MTEVDVITQSKLYDKIKHLAKECNIFLENRKQDRSVDLLFPTLYTVIEAIIKYVIDLRNIQDEYHKLQEILQKHENQIRMHIGLEHQLRLNNQNLQTQLQQSQNIRLETLKVTRGMLAELKRENQTLYEQNRELKKQKNLSFQRIIQKQSQSTQILKQRQQIKRKSNLEINKQNIQHEYSKQNIFNTPQRKKLLKSIYLSKNSDYLKIQEKKKQLKITEIDAKRKIQKRIRQLISTQSQVQLNRYDSQKNNKRISINRLSLKERNCKTIEQS